MHTRVHRRPEMTPELFKYVQAHNPAPDALLRDLKKETQDKSDLSMMQVAASQGTLLALLARLCRAKNAIEIGTFTGYSAICIARALPDDGHLVTCDVDEEMTSIARRYWDRAGVSSKISLRLGSALETLRGLDAKATFEFAFIDADKESYRAYYEELLPRMPSGGLVVFDNTLWHGYVADPENQDVETVAVRALNDFLPTDDRIDMVMLPLFDGVTLCRKR